LATGYSLVLGRTARWHQNSLSHSHHLKWCSTTTYPVPNCHPVYYPCQWVAPMSTQVAS
jgi:hypothetical protein